MRIIRENRKLKKENKALWVAVLALALIAVFFACRYYDELEYRVHTVYEYEHNCTYEWDRFGNYTICK